MKNVLNDRTPPLKKFKGLTAVHAE